MVRIQSVYQHAYDGNKIARPWWEKFSASYGWFAAIVFFVLLVARDFLKEKLTTVYSLVWENTYRQLAGLRLLRRISLRRYRAAVARNNRIVRIPFRPDRPLEMDKVFVRLQVAGRETDVDTNADVALEQVQACVVLGPPGSGKSMLLRKLALDQTRTHGSSVKRVPVLVELSRFNESGGNLEDRISAAFGQNDFPNARRFVEAGLKGGFLYLLLDGLDEVGAEKKGDAPSPRELAVGQIRDLIQRFPACKFLITCRTAVYHGELDDSTERSFSILEFDDRQIQSFMAAWAADMPIGKSAEQLLRSLAERSRILALARNPLMLTIIAFLYTDTDFVLPHSRAEFYSKAVLLLLEHWKLKRNHFRGPHKAIILRHLALWNQDNTGSVVADRRTMELKDVLRQIQIVLPTLTLEPGDAQPLLDEITERSGLLLAVDGGERYQFSHLTLQEFLAAQQLAGDPDGLLSRFSKIPDDWRETVKLWCGLPHDSTDFIETLRLSDSVLAFECIADAEQVEEKTWRSLLEEMCPHLTESDAQTDAIVRSFGFVAADPRPRGQAALEHLQTILATEGTNTQAYASACRAMSLTNLPIAASRLAELAVSDEATRSYLPLMGDLAVPVLSSFLVIGCGEDDPPDFARVWAIAALHRIGTVAAAEALVRVLFESPSTILGCASAWAVSSLVRRPSIETALSQFSVPVRDESRSFLWIWEPFSTATSAVARIMARVAMLIARDPEADAVPDAVVDTRLAIPLLLIVAGVRTPNEAAIHHLKTGLLGASDDVREVVTKEWEQARMASEYQKRWRRMLSGLPRATRFAVMTSLSDCSREQWQHVTKPVAYTFRDSSEARFCLLPYVIVASAGFLAIRSYWLPGPFSAVNPLLFAGALIVCATAAAAPIWSSRAGVSDRLLMNSVLSSLAMALGASLSLCALLVFEIVNFRWHWSSLGLSVAPTIPWLIVALFYEYRWHGGRMPPWRVLMLAFLCCVAPVAFASVIAGVPLLCGLPIMKLSMTLLLPSCLAAAGVLLFMILFNKRESLRALAFSIIAFVLVCLGGYSAIYWCDYHDNTQGVAIITGLLLLLGLFLSSAYYKARLASNPFQTLMTMGEERESMRILWDRFLLLRSTLHRPK